MTDTESTHEQPDTFEGDSSGQPAPNSSRSEKSQDSVQTQGEKQPSQLGSGTDSNSEGTILEEKTMKDEKPKEPTSGDAEPQEPVPEEEYPKDKKKSDPAKAFNDLRNEVGFVRNEVEEVGDFVRIAKDKLLQEAEAYRMEGRRPLLESLFKLHDHLFKAVIAMEAGQGEPNSFVIELLQYLEDELGRYGIYIIRPQPGEAIDLERMEIRNQVPARFWRKPDTVARVHSCGFALQKATSYETLRSAKVDIYRRVK